MLVSPSRNTVRDQLYEAQMEHHNIKGSVLQLKRRLRQETNGGQRYKQAYTKEDFDTNLRERTNYGQRHQGKTIDNFWQYLFFIDEAHIDPSSCAQGNILRERGHRLDSENIQQRGEKTGVKLHIAAWINWHGKTKKLEFYNNENDSIIKPKKPPKPRKSMYQSDKDYQARILEWEASIGHEKEVKLKGNSMAQLYYCERLLPVYINCHVAVRLSDCIKRLSD